jgi:hypothetical protein
MKKTVNSKKKTVNSKSLKNLKPFEKGNTISKLGGRPQLTDEEKEERSVLKYLETANSNFVKSLIKSGKYEEYLQQALINTIAAGKVDGLKFLNDYNGNKPKEQTEHSGEIKTGLTPELQAALQILNERKRNRE